MLDFVNMPINPETPRLFTVLSTFAGAGGSSLGYVWAGGKVDRKSTRLNSSHTVISYAVFCLKKKNRQAISRITQLAKSGVPLPPRRHETLAVDKPRPAEAFKWKYAYAQTGVQHHTSLPQSTA